MKNIKTAEEIIDEIQSKVSMWPYEYLDFKDCVKAMEIHTNQFKPEWVSVESGVLPEKDGEYLLRIDDKIRPWHEVGFFKIEDSEFRTCLGLENIDPIGPQITHWCELPQPPQK